MSDALINSLLQPSIQKFIKDHEDDDERSLVLKHKTIENVSAALVAEQIRGRRKSKLKLPSFYKTSGIIYPPGLNLEQCSSESTAIFKAGLIEKGETFIDLTGGFGVDTFFLSKNFKQTFSIEPNNTLLEIVHHNHGLLGARTIVYKNTTAETFLNSEAISADFIFIDPSRRIDGNKKVYSLSDCIPDITQLQHRILERTNTLLIKTSPLLDLQQGLKELKFVQKIIVIAVDNECKEVLFLCKNGFTDEPTVEAVNLLKRSFIHTFSFHFSEEQGIKPKFSEPLQYLYEPNAAILKAGAFKSVADRYTLNKLHPSTHLYTSDAVRHDFPGRVFKIEALIKPDSKVIKENFAEGVANITTRNYPLSVEQLKRKTGLKDGGKKFLIGFSSQQKKNLAVAVRIV